MLKLFLSKIRLTDMECSGVSSCNIPVGHLIYKAAPCPRELSSYMEASFTCVPGQPFTLTSNYSVAKFCWQGMLRTPGLPHSVGLPGVRVLALSSRIVFLPSGCVHLRSGLDQFVFFRGDPHLVGFDPLAFDVTKTGSIHAFIFVLSACWALQTRNVPAE